MPFYEGLLFNKKRKHSVSNLFKQRDCKHTQAKRLYFNDFIPKIEAFEKKLELT
jgi:hypothetical protein